MYIHICVCRIVWYRIYIIKNQSTTVYKHLVEGAKGKEGRASLISWSPVNEEKDSGHKLKHSKFHLNIIETFSAGWVVRDRNKLPREAVDSPSLDISKTHLERVLSNPLQVTLLWTRAWVGQSSEVPSRPSSSVILQFCWREHNYLDFSEEWFPQLLNFIKTHKSL